MAVFFEEDLAGQTAGRPLPRSGKPGGRGKSGLHEGKAPGKFRRIGWDRFRESATEIKPPRFGAARVKRWG